MRTIYEGKIWYCARDVVQELDYSTAKSNTITNLFKTIPDNWKRRSNNARIKTTEYLAYLGSPGQKKLPFSALTGYETGTSQEYASKWIDYDTAAKKLDEIPSKKKQG